MSDLRLRTTCGSLSLENPFLLASAPPTASYDMIRKAFELGWAGAVTKTIKPDHMSIADVSPRFNAIGSRTGEVYGFENIELVSRRDVAYWVDAISRLKTEFPSKVLIASIMGDREAGSWKALALAMEGARADALELNFSCPHGMPEMGVGAAIGQDPEISARITRWVKEEVGIPVIVKLTPNVTDVATIAEAVCKAGADMIAAINTVESLTGVDLESFEPQPSVGGFSTYGGYSGRAVKPIGLRVVSQIARSVNVPIMGMGGIGEWSDAAEYIALGASAVQVCTEVMVRGLGIIGDLKSGLLSYLEKKSLAGLHELRGKALSRLTTHERLQRGRGRYPFIMPGGPCIRCARCVTACADGGHGAVSLQGGAIVFDYEKCDGCSLCSHVCPVRAIGMQAAVIQADGSADMKAAGAA
jgi:dihydropyrimidine dehydrogenase (NAD+) subunit PreA